MSAQAVAIKTHSTWCADCCFNRIKAIQAPPRAKPPARSTTVWERNTEELVGKYATTSNAAPQKAATHQSWPGRYHNAMPATASANG